ncbi:hypothetical protein [Acinetobacter sp. 102]|uniref:hypothetical protein n=1 Tax=Acinetobacter sp. 102 TaxID=3098766 RepID=UPI003008E203
MVNDFNGLNKLLENAKNLEGERDVSLGTLFNEGFLQTHTDFQTIDDLFVAAGFKVESHEDFEAIPQEEIDKFVRDNTQFESFNDLHAKAAAEYFRKHLLNGLK